MRRRKTVLLIIILLVLVAFSSFLVSKNFKKNNQATTTIEKFNPVCTRIERWENKPQYDRALSLIQQRIQESIELDKGTDGDTAFTNFPPDLVNCIFIKEEDIDDKSGIEGYFALDNNEIKNNYFPITVDKDYKEADDIVTALLIAHEMAHVQQFLVGTPMTPRNECLRAEADAFVTQWMLFGTLSLEEMGSVNARIERKESLHPQLQMLANIREVSLQYALPACGFMSRDCDREVLRVQMFKVLFDDEFYRKQCEK